MTHRRNSHLISDETQRVLSSPNGITAVRYVLALSLIATHFCVLANIPLVWPVDGDMVVKSFFVISGFFILYSYLRTDDVRRYARRRFHRTYPLYIIVVASCTFLGFLFSTLPVGDYFTHAQTWRYLLFNALFLNFAEPTLPGVFTGNYMPAVNGSLWFMKVLVLFYALLPVIVWLMRRWGRLTVLTVLFFLSVAYLELCDHLYAATGRGIFNLLRHQTPGYLPYFIAGMAALMFFERFRKQIGWWLLAAAAIACISIYTDFAPIEHLTPVTYAVVLFTCGLWLRPLRVLHRVPDITYGMYLIHFPVIQALLQEGQGVSAWWLFAAATVVTLALSYLCWRATGR